MHPHETLTNNNNNWPIYHCFSKKKLKQVFLASSVNEFSQIKTENPEYGLFIFQNMGMYKRLGICRTYIPVALNYLRHKLLHFRVT